MLDLENVKPREMHFEIARRRRYSVGAQSAASVSFSPGSASSVKRVWRNSWIVNGGV